MVNCYAQYLPNLSEVLAPLHKLLCKDVQWRWSAEEETALQKSKKMLKSVEVLVHCNPMLPLVVACDASPYGVGAVLSHLMVDGEERPIAYASWSQTPSEKNYSQLDTDAPAVVFATRKFHLYLCDQHFRLYTDHKPQLGLFGPTRAIPQMASVRMHCWILSMATLEYDLHYRPRPENANADGLSRLPLPTAPVELPVLGEVVFLIEHVDSTLDVAHIW